VSNLDPTRVFVNAGFGARYRGLGFLVNVRGDRLAAPVVAEDLVAFGLPLRRRVYLSFDSKSAFWTSAEAIKLIQEAAVYASRGGVRIWLDLQQLTLDPGGHVTRVLAARRVSCGNALHEEIGLTMPLRNPGLYKVRATLSIGKTLLERYTSGLSVRDTALLHSGKRLGTGRDYFRLDGKPYLMAGTNYFCTDPYTSAFFVGGSLGGNAWVWENDFAEMKQQGLTLVRTGIWLNRARYLDLVSGAADERFLRALECYSTRQHAITCTSSSPSLHLTLRRRWSGGRDSKLIASARERILISILLQSKLRSPMSWQLRLAFEMSRS
jgi:hypothetical protein